jgi:hypothetical protein
VRSSPAEADVSAAPPPPPAAAPGPALATVQVKRQAEPGPRVLPSRPAAGIHPTVTAVTPTEDREPANEPPVDEMLKTNVKLDAIMDRANKAYDRQDYDEAKAIAGKVLTKQPGNVRMLRIIVSSS